jgi:hypothetical protein
VFVVTLASIAAGMDGGPDIGKEGSQTVLTCAHASTAARLHHNRAIASRLCRWRAWRPACDWIRIRRHQPVIDPPLLLGVYSPGSSRRFPLQGRGAGGFIGIDRDDRAAAAPWPPLLLTESPTRRMRVPVMRRALERLAREAVGKDHPPLDAGKRSEVTTIASCRDQVAEMEATLNEHADAKLLLAALCLSHDHLGEAQRLIGKREDDLTCYIAGCVHRRLGDFARACYYFRRSSVAELQTLIAAAVMAIPQANLVRGNFPKLVEGGQFHPTPMTGLVQQIGVGGHQSLEPIVRAIQAAEFQQLVLWCGGLGRQKARRLAAV